MSDITEAVKTAAASAANALIEWTGKGIKHIATEAGNAILYPGAITPVPKEIWGIARGWVAHLIVESAFGTEQKHLDEGRFIEHFVKVSTEEIPEKKGPGGKVVEEARTETVVEAKDLADLPESEAKKIIAKIVDLEILKAYSESPSLDGKTAITGAIERQIKAVEEKSKAPSK